MTRAMNPVADFVGVVPSVLLFLCSLAPGCAAEQPSLDSTHADGSQEGGTSAADDTTAAGEQDHAGLPGGVGGALDATGPGGESAVDLLGQQIVTSCRDYCLRATDVDCEGFNESECNVTCPYENWRWQQCREDNVALTRCAADSPTSAWFCGDTGPELLPTTCQSETAAFWACLMRGNIDDLVPKQCPEYCSALTATHCEKALSVDSCAATCELFRVFMDLCRSPLDAYLDCVSALAPSDFECTEDSEPHPVAGACESETSAWKLCSAPFKQ